MQKMRSRNLILHFELKYYEVKRKISKRGGPENDGNF